MVTEEYITKKLQENFNTEELEAVENMLEKSLVMSMFENCQQSSQVLIKDEINQLFEKQVDNSYDEDDFENDDYDDEEDDEE